MKSSPFHNLKKRKPRRNSRDCGNQSFLPLAGFVMGSNGLQAQYKPIRTQAITANL